MSDLNYNSITAGTLASPEKTEKLVVLNTAKRHAIKISNFKAEQNIYKTANTFVSKELITTPVKSIAFYCNEYVPEHFPEGVYFKYALTINGTEYEVLPINSQRNGKKIIRTTENSEFSEYVEYLNEDIKSAILTINLYTPNATETPFVSDIKILIGGE